MIASTALVTGASRGIGKAIAECFAKDGTNLVVSARRIESLTPLVEEWEQRFGIRVKAFAADLAQPGEAARLADAILADGIELDYLVNNAGYGLFGLFKDTALEDELAMMRVNMEAVTILCKRFLPGLRARRGRIMNVASTAAFQAGPYMSVYYATKSYVLLFSEALAEELQGSGLTVTAFCPGPTRSDFQARAAMDHSAMIKGKLTTLPSAEAVGILGYRAMMAGDRVYVPGLMNRLGVNLNRMLPRAWVNRVVKKLSAPVT